MVSVPDRANDPPPDAVGGGGTGFRRKSPEFVVPQLLRSRLTCDGGGAMTAGAGRVSFEAEETSRAGAETGGATTSTLCDIGARELARSRCASRGAGATTVCASGFAVRIWSRETLGAGATTEALRLGDVRARVRATSGAGGTILSFKALAARLVGAFTSGEGGTTVISGNEGATSFERSPSAGGGPGSDLKASKFATAESEWGRLIFGASTIFSLGLSPRATRMVCVRCFAS